MNTNLTYTPISDYGIIVDCQTVASSENEAQRSHKAKNAVKKGYSEK